MQFHIKQLNKKKRFNFDDSSRIRFFIFCFFIFSNIWFHQPIPLTINSRRNHRSAGELMAAFDLLIIVALTIFSSVPAARGNSDGDALSALRRSLTDPDKVLQSWDPNLVSPCTWFHVTCNQDNRVTRLYVYALIYLSICIYRCLPS